ncbi:Piso0_003699 [Millerozyma farinosa CBS 7064]|uniref:Piso0_003699 protein n=1 Tax=Pichia sorbitophila (strain ATCC MYA-4447 / BCRC 22081 / CBS 7064 / NBRC 10061 / NRRL Y-12695) TaxID=559304 RepID=G8Y6C8_PICSO|nr:Piso0_003699 [Millerozyma farinosa CBS 7064]CCE84158.1 Piso0_003699 [Millerozyma farinosa CBS 7064]
MRRERILGKTFGVRLDVWLDVSNLGAKNLFYCTPLSNDHVLGQVNNFLLSFPKGLDREAEKKTVERGGTRKYLARLDSDRV